MAKIEIKNIGPIKEASFELNKVNVFMGEQGSGKSTIAKIVSFCTWLDKKFSRDGFEEDIKRVLKGGESPNYIKLLKTYHRLADSYFSDDSSIYFEGEEIAFRYNCNPKTNTSYVLGIESQEEKYEVRFKSGRRRVSSKVIYIPSERNFVSAVYNLQEYLRDKDLIQDFVNNWFEAKRKYSKDHKLEILKLGVHYNNEGEEIDRLTLYNGKELTLQTASSGFQSVVPLIALFDYIANGIYNESRPMSVSDRDEVIRQYNEMLKQKNEGDTAIKANDLSDLLNILFSQNYQYSQFIIEEPEQNLFPKTQRGLIYYMMQVLNDSERDHRLTFTTHSPYILYALNNCMMGYLIKDSMPKDEQTELLSRNSWIDPTLVSIWEITEYGTIRQIKNERTGTVSKHYFNGIMNDVMEEYYDMLTYLKPEEDGK